MRNDMTEIGSRIKALIDDSGETQTALARALNIDESAVSRLISGRRGLSAAELADLCAHFEVTSDEVLFSGAEVAGAVLRAEDGADTDAAVAATTRAFDDYLYLRALVGAA